MIIKLNEADSKKYQYGIKYAIANTADADPMSEDFWGWDVEYDVGYEHSYIPFIM